MSILSLRHGVAVLSMVCLSPSLACAALTHAKFDSPFTVADIVAFGTTQTDVWGAENAAPVTGELGITPADGDRMLRVADDGSATTSVGQLVGVEHLSADIDAGAVVANWITCFNSPTGQHAASGQVFLQYFDASETLISTSIAEQVTGIDSDPSTWNEHILVNAPLPVGTRRVRAVFEFDSASLNGLPIFADKFTLGFSSVPEPTSAMLLLAGVAAFRRPRR